MGLVWRGRRNGGDERKRERERERERERKEQKENGMLKGTERGKFIFCFKEAENEKGADAPVEGENAKSKTFAPAGNRTRGERMGTVHFTTKPLAQSQRFYFGETLRLKQ